MIDINKLLFVDIETHFGKPWDQRTEALRQSFIDHYYDEEKYEDPKDHFHEIAGLHAEYGQVIWVSIGYESNGEFKTASFGGPDEVKILTDLEKVFGSFQRNDYVLAGHNILRYDLPFLCKRYVLNRLQVPDYINSYGVKPWEQSHIDTMDLWKMGSWSNVSLQTICAAMDIPCKTDEIGGRNLYTYDLDNMPWDKLGHYCTEDVESNYKMLKIILEHYET